MTQVTDGEEKGSRIQRLANFPVHVVRKTHYKLCVRTLTSLKSLRKSIPIFQELSLPEFEALSKHLIERKVGKGACVIRSSEESATLFFLMSGKLRVEISNREGKELSIALLKAGEFFGEMSLLTGSSRTADVVAVTDCVLLALSRDDFFNHIRRHQGLLLHMLRTMAERLYATSARLADFALLDVQSRLIKTLTALSRPGGDAERDVRVIEERTTHKELAAMVGTSREVVSRILSSLVESGAIEIKSGRIVMHGF